ncbi:TolC family protein [Thiosulfativibrio zosterae]|uniref:Transporter n=1 Tax=Thiosulfativibrio zosterae TaxID=2675053 RepID=A0A6F8PLB4_9GAMM|nr:TolC family protein [Thiosulfativibrio zosterae]BBP42876.1 hypothetical protein THMIRHAT_06220 [Thiosulfativibrio zosterae]
MNSTSLLLKTKLKALSVACILAMPALVSAQTLDFKACVEATLSQNPEVAVSQYRKQQAEMALKEADAHRLPQITASMTASQSDNALNVFGMKLQQRQASFSDFGFDNNAMSQISAGNYAYQPNDLNNPGSHNDFNTRIEVLIPVWNGGKVSSYQDQAKAMIQAADHADTAVQQFLTFNVFQAYQGVHTARAYIEVANQAVKASQAYVNTTHSLVEQGVVVMSELLTAKVHLTEAKTALEQAKKEEQIALESLKMLMGLSTSENLDVAGSVNISMPADTVDEILVMAMNANPKLDAQRQQAQSAVAAIDAVKADNYPSFNLMARNDWNDDSLGLGSSAYTVAGVVSWKLTDFGATSSAIDRAAAAANEKKAAVRSEENKTRLEVLTAWKSLQVAIKQADSQRVAVGQADEAQRLVMKRYEGGIATMTEVLVSQAQLDKVRADLVKTQYEINIYKAQLRLATGTLSLAQL